VFVAVIVVAYMIVVLRDSVQYRAMHFDIPSVSVSVCLSVCFKPVLLKKSTQCYNFLMSRIIICKVLQSEAVNTNVKQTQKRRDVRKDWVIESLKLHDIIINASMC